VNVRDSGVSKKVKVRVLANRAAYVRKLVNSNTLQSWKWQMMS